MTDYSKERYDPSLAMCRDLELRFDGQTLTFYAGGKIYTYHAVSGEPLPDGSFPYDDARQRIPGIGPTPEGIYWINPSEMWTNGRLVRGSRSSWGNHRITIHPFTTTETFGRGGFFIHGGSVPGSHGCIDLTSEMDRFTDDLVREVGAGQNCQIHLTVDYLGPGDFNVPKNDLRTA
jgi:hypothetical protein